MSIKNIVFDLGRVLIKFEPKEYTEQNIPEEKREAFYNGVFGSDEWQMLDRGTLSYEDAKKIFKERIPGVDEQIDRLFDIICIFYQIFISLPLSIFLKSMIFSGCLTGIQFHATTIF